MSLREIGIIVICFAIFYICSECRTSANERQKAQERAEYEEKQAKYEALFYEQYGDIIQRYQNKEIETINRAIQLEGGIFCLSYGINAWTSFNEKLKDAGYHVTFNRDSLRYFIFTESKSHLEGYYSNGGEARRREVSIIALDVPNEVAYVLRRDPGGMPPMTISVKKGSKRGDVGRYMDNDDVYHFLTSKALVKP